VEPFSVSGQHPWMAKKKTTKKAPAPKRVTRRSKMSRLDVMFPKRLRQIMDIVAEDQGCATASEYLRRLAREDALARGFNLNEKHPLERKRGSLR